MNRERFGRPLHTGDQSLSQPFRTLDSVAQQVVGRFLELERAFPIIDAESVTEI